MPVSNPVITSLDMKSRKNFLDSVSKLCKEKTTTTICITHHIEEIV